MRGKRERIATPRGGGLHVTWSLLCLAGVAGCVPIGAPDPNVRYVAFGDSATRGPSTRDFPDILGELLEAPAESFANEGQGGETSSEGLLRLRTLLNDEMYPNASTLLLWEGGNDVTDFIGEHDPLVLYSPDADDYPFRSELNDLLADVQFNLSEAVQTGQAADLTVFLATYYFLREDFDECDALPFDLIFPAQAVRANVYLERLNETIRNVAGQTGGVLVDVATRDDVLRSDRDNYFNCNHLSEQGNEIVAQLFADVINAAKP